MRELGDAGVLRNQLKVIAEGTFPAQGLVGATQILKPFTDVKSLAAILLLHSLNTSSGPNARVDGVGKLSRPLRGQRQSSNPGPLPNGKRARFAPGVTRANAWS